MNVCTNETEARRTSKREMRLHQTKSCVVVVAVGIGKRGYRLTQVILKCLFRDYEVIFRLFFLNRPQMRMSPGMAAKGDSCRTHLFDFFPSQQWLAHDRHGLARPGVQFAAVI